MSSERAVIDRLSDIQLDLEKVDGTLATILDLGDEEAMNQPSPKHLLSMLQLMADIVSPTCEELKVIMQELDTERTAPTPPQGQRARVNKKGR